MGLLFMGNRRREKALGASLEQRISKRQADPAGRFIDGSSRQKAVEKLNRKMQRVRLPLFAGASRHVELSR